MIVMMRCAPWANQCRSQTTGYEPCPSLFFQQCLWSKPSDQDSNLQLLLSKQVPVAQGTLMAYSFTLSQRFPFECLSRAQMLYRVEKSRLLKCLMGMFSKGSTHLGMREKRIRFLQSKQNCCCCVFSIICLSKEEISSGWCLAIMPTYT